MGSGMRKRFFAPAWASGTSGSPGVHPAAAARSQPSTIAKAGPSM